MKKKNFVLIIGNIVTKRIEKDGMNRRIIAIDDILSDYNKIYIENVRNKSKGIARHLGRCFVNCFHRLTKNPRRFYNKNVDSYKAVSETSLNSLFSDAGCIYIHSLYSAMKFPLELLQKFSGKIIIDAHGCVVEEMEFGEQDGEKIAKAKLYEKTLFPRLKAVVCVSKNMIDFYKSKYGMENVQFIELPIFAKQRYTNYADSGKSFNKKIVYSGGTNKWQNIDEMIQVIKNLPQDFEVKIISPDTQYFKNRLENIKNVTVKAVAPEQVRSEYEDCTYGFILRDNIVVNHVACPTKLIEYMAANLLPVVSYEGIGDFERLGYKYLPVNDLLAGNLPSGAELAQMTDYNTEILKKLEKICDNAALELKNLVNSTLNN